MRRLSAAFIVCLVGSATAEDAATNRFNFELYHRLAARPGNLFFSAYSIHSALAMTYAGARGKTAREMETVLHYGPKTHAEAKALAERLGARSGFELSVANALWPQRGFTLKPAFLDLVKAHYGAPVHPVDYIRAAEAARKRINGWVEERTKERIKELIDPGILDADTRLVLTNAIYFKAGWVTPFTQGATRPADFHLSPDKSVTVPTMQVVGPFRYFRWAEGFVIELPYKGGATMTILAMDDISKAMLDIDTTAGLRKAMRGERIHLHLPKFKTTSQFELAGTLQTMGMPTAFSGQADFSGMTETEDRLQISEVIHKAFVSVDEKGTEAAAATAVVMKRGAAAQPSKPRVVRVDKPFLFWIRHRATNTILFMGRIVDPR